MALAMKNIPSLAVLADLIGREAAVSDWMEIDQERIDRFAAATGDRQWIHVNHERCRQLPELGGTISHGLLTLSAVSALMQETIAIGGVGMALNYGLNRVRFPRPVQTGSRIRARFTLLSCEEVGDSVQAIWQTTVEIEGGGKPACVAEMLLRYYPAKP